MQHHFYPHIPNDDAVEQSTSHANQATVSDQAQLTRDFHCVLCVASLTTKFNCERHLLEQHLIGKLRCCTCEKTVAVGTKIEDSCAYKEQCHAANYRPTKPQRTVYACPITGKCFSEIKAYVSHLSPLCKTPKHTRPRPSFSRQIFGILKYRDLLQHLAAASVRVGSHVDWAPIQLSNEVAKRALEEFEHIQVTPKGIVYVESHLFGGQAVLQMEVYLEKLLRSGQPLRMHPPQVLPEDLRQNARYIYACEGANEHTLLNQDSFGDAFKPAIFAENSYLDESMNESSGQYWRAGNIVGNRSIPSTSSLDPHYPQEKGKQPLDTHFAQYAGYSQVAGINLPSQEHGETDMQLIWNNYAQQMPNDNNDVQNWNLGPILPPANNPLPYDSFYASPNDSARVAADLAVTSGSHDDVSSPFGQTRGSLTSPSSSTSVADLWPSDEDIGLTRRYTSDK